MRLPLLPVIILLIIGILADIYIYRRLRCHHVRRWWCVGYVVLAVVASLALLAVICLPKRSGEEAALTAIMWTLYGYFSIYLPKYIFTVFSLTGRLAGRILHRRTTAVGITGAVIGLIVFGAMWAGALYGRFDTEVKQVDVAIANLPTAFDGMTIAQISDLHTGTYAGDTAYLAELVDTINAMSPDMIVFTGDIVNRRSAELPPYMPVLSRLRAPMGVWSIMGNHDYGDYYNWPDERAHLADADSLKAMHAAMGWHMLNNTHARLRRANDSITLIGVENIGDPPFRIYGSLDKTCENLTDSTVKILLSHNPQHWADSIQNNPHRDIALTLSGHTHAMQMEIFGWSPASWRYKTWGGLYADTLGRHLYVNIGIGAVGIPARIGQARPEVTLITLRRKP